MRCFMSASVSLLRGTANTVRQEIRCAFVSACTPDFLPDCVGCFYPLNGDADAGIKPRIDDWALGEFDRYKEDLYDLETCL